MSMSYMEARSAMPMGHDTLLHTKLQAADNTPGIAGTSTVNCNPPLLGCSEPIGTGGLRVEISADPPHHLMNHRRDDQEAPLVNLPTRFEKNGR